MRSRLSRNTALPGPITSTPLAFSQSSPNAHSTAILIPQSPPSCSPIASPLASPKNDHQTNQPTPSISHIAKLASKSGRKRSGSRVNSNKIVKKSQRLSSSSSSSSSYTRKKRNYTSYNRYIRRVNHIIPGNRSLKLSKETVSILDTFLHDMFGRLAQTAGDLVKSANRKTLTAHDIESATKLLLPTEMAKCAILWGNGATRKLCSSDE